MMFANEIVKPYHAGVTQRGSNPNETPMQKSPTKKAIFTDLQDLRTLAHTIVNIEK